MKKQTARRKRKKDGDTLTRSGLAKALYDDMGAIGDAYKFVGEFFTLLGEEIVKNDEVKLHGFGKFRCLRKKKRLGRNPQTGERVEIKPRRVVSFIAGGKFKRIMAQDKDEE